MGSERDKFGPDAELSSFTQDELLARFDACVDAGVIKFDYNFITRVHTIDGIDVSNLPLNPTNAPLHFKC
jgi:hypothetical protein